MLRLPGMLGPFNQDDTIQSSLICSDLQSIIKNYESYVINWTRQLAIQRRRPTIAFVRIGAQSGKLQASSVKLQATSYKLQATSIKRQDKRQATSVECGPNRQAPSMAFRDDLTADRGSLYSRKVLRVQERRLGL